MKPFARIALALALVFGASALTGCAGLSNLKSNWDALTSVQVSADAVIVAANTFNALEATATNYLSLKRCTGSNGPICRSPAATKKIVAYVRAGRQARDAAEEFVRTHPGTLGPTGLLDALSAANGGLQAVFAQYKVK